jgi:hypothetical protein
MLSSPCPDYLIPNLSTATVLIKLKPQTSFLKSRKEKLMTSSGCFIQVNLIPAFLSADSVERKTYAEITRTEYIKTKLNLVFFSSSIPTPEETNKKLQISVT